MIYPDICEGSFIERLNRFVAVVEMDGKTEICHVKNTGRCRELFVPGAGVFLQRHEPGARKTNYDLIAVKKRDRLINVDSQAPNRVFREWAEGGGFLPGITRIQPEFRCLNSRFDFLLELSGRKALVEVKGVTLEEDGAALFPDAPTERGVKHLRELAEARTLGFDAFAVFVIQMKGIAYFTPNGRTHPAFGQALRDAQNAGVGVCAVDCAVTPRSIAAGERVEVRLGL
jgi:sugar fermentation stimulation protein A